MSDTVHLLITSGTGPEECCLAVQYLIEYMRDVASSHALKLDDSTPKKKDAKLPRSVILTVSGDGAEQFARLFVGTVRVVFKSPTRPSHKRQNWYVGVQKLDDTLLDNTASDDIDLSEVRFETLRAGGPGGQHQNTTDSAVRAVHIPTGISTLARDERSQHRNKQVAVKRLSAMLEMIAQEGRETGKREVFKQHRALERGNEVLTIRR